MKTLIFTLCIFVLSITVNGQHTLAFNRTLLLVNGISYTVPANATWKIENVFFTSNANNMFYSNVNYQPTLSITPPAGSATTVYYMAQGYNTSTLTNGNTMPCWLPEGTAITPTGVTSMLSVIEFVVQ